MINLSKFGSRKFLALIVGLAVITIVFLILAFAIKQFANNHFGNFILGISGLIATYLGANTVVNFSKTK